MEALKSAVAAINRERPHAVVVFTGAGVSADSGIPTFRGEGGLWRNYRPEDLATPSAFARNPLLVWEWYESRRALVREAQPNAAHLAIARMHHAVVVTQNVDGLHARAGSRRVIELHGNLFRARCVREGSVHDAPEPFPEVPPKCACGAMLRPDVVWFGEMLPEGLFEQAGEAVSHADLLLVIGTSGVVYPAAGLVALHHGMSIEINPQASGACEYSIAARAAEVTPAIVDAILAA